ncbi:MAG TPA: metal ABC transporter substrate-binding protein [Propionibacteriaceae bacterium]|nr:metal ABC transporter substrate-binding protein [Propionibacteriaceae bacterium]
MIRHPRAITASLAAGVLLLVSACTGAPTAADGKLTIVTSFYPLQFVAERVAGEHARVANLTTPGAEPHDLELTPKQIASLSDADLVIYQNGFQAAVDAGVSQASPKTLLDVTTVVPLVDTGAHEGHEEDGADTHADELDPHLWLDPTNMKAIADEVALQLSALDPTNAADYEQGAADLVAELTSLDTDFRTGLAKCERSEFITSHAAFGYLAKAYGLEQIGISGLSPDAEPSPARIAEIQTIATDLGVTTIFFETLVSPDTATSIASDLGLTTDVLDPIEGITPESKGDDYIEVMRANLAALTTANGCS